MLLVILTTFLASLSVVSANARDTIPTTTPPVPSYEPNSNCTATNIILCAGDVCNDQTTSYLEVQTSQIITIYQGSNCVWTFTNAYSETLQVTLSGFYQFYPRFITEDSSTSTWSWGDVVPFKLPLPDVSQYVGDLTDEQI